MINMTDKWDRRFIELAKHVAQWSKDPSTQVGAVLVDPETNLVKGIGYNGFARGVADTVERLHDRPTKYAMVVHAEVNAILMAGSKAKGCSLYVWPSFSIPCICHDCCKTAIQAGVKEVVGLTPSPEDAERAKRWQDSIDISRVMCDEAGVTYREIT
jgi:dCMP deaminase